MTAPPGLPAGGLAALVAAVGLGSALGGVARLLVGAAVTRLAGAALPWGTLAVNVSGAFAIGVVAGLAADAPALWAAGVTGFLGSYTTVSALSLQTLDLARAGAPGRAAANVALTLALGLAAAAAGLAAGAAR